MNYLLTTSRNPKCGRLREKRRPERRVRSATSFVDHLAEQHSTECPIDQVKADEQHGPRAALVHRVALNEKAGGLDRRQHAGNDQWK